jgi:hypothetical protein
MASAPRNDLQAQRRRAVKTAWLLAVIAAGIFTAFVLSGVLKS